jgi:hypothetical protein
MIPPADNSSPGDKPQPQPTPLPKAALRQDKRPLPLLSRSKLKRPRQLDEEGSLSPTQTSTATSDAPVEPEAEISLLRRRLPLAVRLLLRPVAYATLVGLAYLAIHFLRQTQVQGVVQAPPGRALPQEVCLVRDFSDDIRTLRTEYRMASAPFENDMRMKRESLARVQADLAGLTQRKTLIGQQMADDQKEIEAAADSSEAEAARIWQTDGAAIDAEYAQKLAAFKQTLLDRAKELGLPLTLDDDPASPEVWVNAFRLVLYNPPPAVKAPEQRTWVEKQLTDWHAYEADLDTRRGAIKTKTDAVRQGVGSRITDAKARMDQRRQEIAEADSTSVPLQSEFDTLKTETEQAESREQQQRATYADQLTTIPSRNVIEKFPLSSDGHFSWTHLEQQAKYLPGSYFLWAEVKNGDDRYWALVPFKVTEYSRLDLVLQSGAFVPAADLLK